MTKTTKTANIVYLLLVVLLLLDRMDSFDIKSQVLKSLVYYGILTGTLVILLLNTFTIKSISQKIIGMIVPVVIFVMILSTGLLKYLNSSSAWKTQTIVYQNGHLSFKKVVNQMQDAGAFGYNSRTVQVTYLTPLFMMVSEVPANIDQKVEWVKVDKEVNELNLKY